jgi:hypothetical protein
VSRLEAEAERNLTGHSVPSPDDYPSRTLGFGDPTPHGRKTYRVSSGHYSPPSYPTFDSIVEKNLDEREFLGLGTSLITDAQQLGELPEQHLALLVTPGMVVWLFAEVTNDGSETASCTLEDKSVALGVRFRLSIWNSPDNHLHIIRGWILGKNTIPRWITDAVAVVTTHPATLVPDGSISREFRYLSTHQKASNPVNGESIFDPGLPVGGDGVVPDWGCFQEDFSFSIALKQR